MPSVKSRKLTRRSRMGCYSCKKLRIKVCNEIFEVWIFFTEIFTNFSVTNKDPIASIVDIRAGIVFIRLLQVWMKSCLREGMEIVLSR